MSLLELHQAGKSFGSQQVLNNLEMAVPEGAIFGFVGENGAGKTTTMRLILGLEQLDHGTIQIAGRPVEYGGATTNQLTGYLPDVPAFYDYLTAAEYLRLCGQITGLPQGELDTRIKTMLTRVGLATGSRRIKGFSRGMRQRLGIAQALLNQPRLLICDEPTSALDPEGRNQFLELLASLRGQTTVLFSTHILADVERICDHVGILDQGRLQVCDTLTALKQQYAQPQLIWRFAQVDAANRFAQALAAQPNWGQVTTATQQVRLAYQGPAEPLIRRAWQLLLQMDLTPLAMEQVAPSLEQIFLKVVGQP
ncbi:ABC transporter ATP-binding protein [Lapidilactobacillus luobeiensis]|uniref:ABC transporter ATP-binding protein n=1 Tax=Lapidilactobacillus luobeiensis TaxID=2950371 RepID=UPI0021C2BA64|nr:ABC transporter ATP-binding protein [Lapidilactobacillus luobeiensis]